MRTAVEKALEELVDVVPAGVDGFYYQGQELKDKKCKEVEAFKGIDTLHKLYAVLRKSWSSSTAYKSCQSEWVSEDPSYGQCAITATLVYDMFGGSIHRIRVEGGGTHYFNKITGQYVILHVNSLTCIILKLHMNQMKQCKGNIAVKIRIQMQDIGNCREILSHI